MKNKKILWLVIILIVLIAAFFLPGTLSKFASKVSGDAIGNIAFYVIDLDYQSVEINLDKIIPSDEYYKYNFKVSNYNETKRLETNAEYNIIIRTTTNLNLEYKLYKNGVEEDILIEKEIVPDNDGTYFNIMKTEKENFGFVKDEMNEYTLLIKFPKEYISFDYQDLIESVEIIVNSSQIIN